MPTAILGSKGHITIPKQVRDALGVGAGDRLEFFQDEKGVFRLFAVTRDVRHLKGFIAKPFTAVSVKDMNRAVRGIERR